MMEERGRGGKEEEERKNGDKEEQEEAVMWETADDMKTDGM